MFEVVEHQQQCGKWRSVPAAPRQASAGRHRETQDRRDLRRDERGVIDRSEGNERDIPGERIGRGARHSKGQASLADATGTGERQQPVLPGMQERDDGPHVLFTADERRTLTR